jgi:two-component sensor histidine kinase
MKKKQVEKSIPLKESDSQKIIRDLQLNNIAELALDISKVTSDYKEIIDVITQKLTDTLGDACIIHLLNDKDLIAESKYQHDVKTMELLNDIFSDSSLNRNDSLPRYVIKTGESVIVPEIEKNNITQFKGADLNYPEKFGFSSLIIVPMLWQNETIGTISLARNAEGNPFTRDHLIFLQNVAARLSFTISNGRLLKVLVKEIEDRKTLMRELYHRTKNNLQVISSLLSIKSDLVENQEMKSILEDMGNRIQTIALIHQKLYQSKSLSHIDLKEFITDLSNLLITSFSVIQKKVTIDLRLESIVVSIDRAIPCGLILNELISNSLKYAFPGDMKGRIIIHLNKKENETIVINISDNGIGIPEDYNFMEKNTLGMLLLKSIAEEQLQGELKIETKNGVSFTIRFKDVLH